MSREYRDLLVKAVPADGDLEQKARGMIPRGGSMKLRSRLWDKREKLNRPGSRLDKRYGRATRYLYSRYPGGTTRGGRERTGRYQW